MKTVREDRIVPAERAALRSWQRRMIISFSITMTGLVLLIGADLLFGLSETAATIGFGLLVINVIVGGFIQFRAKCPRCDFRIGLQSRLVVPENCRRCGVWLR